MNTAKKYSMMFVLVITALLASAVMPVFADSSKTEAINEAKASFADLYEQINPSVVYLSIY